MKQRLQFIGTLLVSVLLLVLGFVFVFLPAWKDLPDVSRDYLRAEVLDIISDDIQEHDGQMTEENITFQALLKSGSNKGSTVIAKQNRTSYISFEAKKVQKGDQVIVSFLSTGDLDDEFFFAEYVRSDYLLVLVIIFFLALILFGRTKGLKTALSLALTVASVFLVFIPAILSARPVIFWAAAVVLYIIFMTLLLVNGWSLLTLSSILGCTVGIILSVLLQILSEIILKITGYTDEHSVYLSYMNIDLKGIVYAAMIIGAVGAIMDVAVNISAALHEIAIKVDEPSCKSLMKSGFTIGRDILGTMTNTLVLAYVGGSLCSILLLIYSNARSPLMLFNREAVVNELLQILIGSLALLLTIPATTAICSLLFSSQRFKAKKTELLAKENSPDVDHYADELDELNRAFDSADQKQKVRDPEDV